jgi:uncharacterized protein YjbI with pentapeptide repeats
VGVALLATQCQADSRLADRQDRLENLRFVRDRAGGNQSRPFAQLDMTNQGLAGLDLRNADSKEATLTDASLQDADLRLAKGFADVEFEGVIPDEQSAVLRDADLSFTQLPRSLAGAAVQRQSRRRVRSRF